MYISIKTLFCNEIIQFKKSTIKSAPSKNIVIYLILIITNKKKLEFAYCYISCGKSIAAGTTVNTLSEIVADLVGHPFVDFVVILAVDSEMLEIKIDVTVGFDF